MHAHCNQHSSPAEKIALFRSLFRGREDVYPRRFESRRTGKSGYSPACANEWVRDVCQKPTIKCADCWLVVVLLVLGCGRSGVKPVSATQVAAGWEYYRLGEFDLAVREFQRAAGAAATREAGGFGEAQVWPWRAPDPDLRPSRRRASPWALTVLIWRSFFFEASAGYLNRLLVATGLFELLVGLDQFLGWGGIFTPGAPPAWLGDPRLILTACIVWGFPWVGSFAVLTHLAKLQGIGKDVYEAAEIDGASPCRPQMIGHSGLLQVPPRHADRTNQP